jgi:hypothetical protein
MGGRTTVKRLHTKAGSGQREARLQELDAEIAAHLARLKELVAENTRAADELRATCKRVLNPRKEGKR